MPVFHTKTIETILEPVAQQVSRLVILHEEVQDGNAMPDLSRPVQAVSKAVCNLAKVGRETITTSNDPILRHEMPAALQRVEKASRLLEEASEGLKADPFSQASCKKLIEGARGILQGTSALLLCFDDSEVRKIIKECQTVLKYINITEVVETMEDLIQFVKDLRPCLTQLSRDIDAREKELTHQVHREILVRCLDSIKTLTPILICSMKAVIQVIAQGGPEIQEAIDNRNFLAQRITDEVNEIIRVLQLTTYDEDEWDADFLAVLKKLESAIVSRMKPSHDWLEDPTSVTGGFGERSVRQVLECGQRVASHALASDSQAISKLCGDIAAMTDALCELRQAEKGGTPQAEVLAHGIDQKLRELSQRISQAVGNVRQSGFQQPAHTLRGRLEQAGAWLSNPTPENTQLGKTAIHLITEDAMKLATSSLPHLQTSIQQSCSQINKMTAKMAALCTRGEGHSMEAKETASQLKPLLEELKSKMQNALYHRVVEDFLDISPALKKFTEVVRSPPDMANRDKEFEEKSHSLCAFSHRMANTAKNLATAGAPTKKVSEALLSSSAQIESLTPQLCKAGKIKMVYTDNKAIDEHFENLQRQYDDGLLKLRDLADEATDTGNFLKATEENLVHHCEQCELAIQCCQPQQLVEHTANIARLANRVIMVARQECENSEDPAFVGPLDHAAQQLQSCIPPFVKDSKEVALSLPNSSSLPKWRTSKQAILCAVGDVMKAITSVPSEEEPPQVPPPPDMRNLHISDGIPNFYEIFNVDFNSLYKMPIDFGKHAAMPPTCDQPSSPSLSSSAPSPDLSQQSSLGMSALNGSVGHLIPPPSLVQHSLQNGGFLENGTHEEHEQPPPRPPLPSEDAPPPRPPLPAELDDEYEAHFPVPQPNQPIMMAAHVLHQEMKQWSSQDNQIVAAAKQMALLMAKLSGLVRGEGSSKKELIACAKAIADASEEVTQMAKNLAKLCTDKRMRMNILQVCERIPTIGTQLRILSTVKATMLGAHVSIPMKDDGSELRYGTEEDREATEMLVGNAQNLMQSVKETVRACEVAHIKIRTDSGIKMKWVRKQPWYQVTY